MLFCCSSTRDNNLTLSDLREWMTWSPKLILFTLLTAELHLPCLDKEPGVPSQPSFQPSANLC